MKITKYENINAYAENVLPILCENEIQNNIFIGCINSALKGGDTTNWTYLTVDDDAVWSDKKKKIKIIALRTPPMSLNLYAPDNIIAPEAVKTIVEYIRTINQNENNICKINGVISESRLADMFLSYIGLDVKYRSDMTIQVMRKLNDVKTVDGTLRLFCEKDLEYLPRWICGFRDDCNLTEDYNEEEVRNQLKDSLGWMLQYIWEIEGVPVSMARMKRKCEHGMHIGPVYTPPEHRNRGYSTACVKALCEIAMKMENTEYCSLFADILNPISNRVYHKLGFCDVCNYSDIKFMI